MRGGSFSQVSSCSSPAHSQGGLVTSGMLPAEDLHDAALRRGAAPGDAGFFIARGCLAAAWSMGRIGYAHGLDGGFRCLDDGEGDAGRVGVGVADGRSARLMGTGAQPSMTRQRLRSAGPSSSCWRRKAPAVPRQRVPSAARRSTEDGRGSRSSLVTSAVSRSRSASCGPSRAARIRVEHGLVKGRDAT